MLSIAVCDDEVMECCDMAEKIREILKEMEIPCIIRQFEGAESFCRRRNALILFFLIL